MKNQKKYVIPANVLPEGAKLKNGEEMTPSMVGAFYGSSLEYNVSAQIRISNAGNALAPAHDDLKKLCKPKKQKGEFGAFKEDSEGWKSMDKELGKRIIELPTIKDIREVTKDIDDFMVNIENLDQQFTLTDGRKVKASELNSLFLQYKEENSKLAASKRQAVRDHGAERKFINGRVVRPEYSQELMDELIALSKNQYSRTGVDLIITISGKHTIAKDNKFFSGTLTQEQLDELSDVLNYKDHNSFVSGKILRNRLVVPIQTVNQLRAVLAHVTGRGIVSGQLSTTLNKLPNIILMRE